MLSLSRRSALQSLGALALIAAAGNAFGADATSDPRRPIAEFQAALLAVMKAGRSTPFSQRCAMLKPALERSFDMPSVLKLTVGPRWNSLGSTEQSRLLQTFLDYSVASWVAPFDSYAGQTFRFRGTDRRITDDSCVVGTELVSASNEAHRLDFVVRLGGTGWRAVDVLADGTISRIAILRSDFRALLNDGTGAALAGALEKKTTDLASGLTA